MTTPPKVLDVKPASNPVLTFEDLDQILKQAEGRMKAMQAQVGGGRGIPLHNLFFLLIDEAAKRRKELSLLPKEEPK